MFVRAEERLRARGKRRSLRLSDQVCEGKKASYKQVIEVSPSGP